MSRTIEKFPGTLNIDGKIFNLFFLDWESFYHEEVGYTLKNISSVEYIRDRRFKVHGFGYDSMGCKAWISGDKALNFLSTFDWSSIALVGHNLKFDGFILKERFNIVPALYIDTLGMARAVLGHRLKNFDLRSLAVFYGLNPKGVMKTNGVKNLSKTQEAELADYCLNDVDLCKHIYHKLAPEFPVGQYDVMDFTVRMFVEPRLELDVPMLEKACQAENERREAFFQRPGWDKEVFSSNKKFAELLSSKGYEVPVKKSPRTGKFIPALALGDGEFLDMLESKDAALKELCDARVAAKSTIFETRAYKLAQVGKTGQWPFDIQFSGARQTHRFSGGNGAAGNPQNLPKEGPIREAVKAPAGYRLVVGDWANIEMRIEAYLARESGLIESIGKDEDVYCKFASSYFKRAITKADKKERGFGKTSILGLGYGMWVDKFVRQVRKELGTRIEPEEAKRLILFYRSYYPSIPMFWDYLDGVLSLLTNDIMTPYPTVPAIMFEHEAIVLPSGLKLKYPGLKKVGRGFTYNAHRKKGEAEAVGIWGAKLAENICQALAGEICKEALLEINKSWNVVGQVHDELLVIAPEELYLDCAYEVKELMEKTPVWFPQLKLKAEIGVGRTWAEAKKNPLTF